MFPCSALPPPLFPTLLRPPGAFSSPLTRSLPSGFLVEDILGLGQPVGYLQKTLSSRNPGNMLAQGTVPGGSERTVGAAAERLVLHSPGQPSCSNPGPPQTACPNSGLKFGVSAILAPATRSGEWDTGI